MTAISSVSAIVTTFNVGELVIDTVDSLRQQTLAPQEIIVVDDASTDPVSREALSRLERDGDVLLVRQAANSGVSAARNRGIRAASGDAFLIIDGDDMFEPQSVAAFVRALNSTPGAGFAYPTVRTFGNRNDVFPAPPFNLYALHQVNICPIASMIHRDVVDAGVWFADDINPEDWDFWLRAADAGFLGVAAQRAVLVWRRWGFTRLAQTRSDGLISPIRRRRPELFRRERLLAIKARWAPALSVIDAGATADYDPPAGDVEVVAHPADARGRVLLLTRGPMRTRELGEFAIERFLRIFESQAHPDACLLVDPAALRVPLPVGETLRAGDLADEHVPRTAVVGVCVRRGGITWHACLDGENDWAELMSAFTHLTRTNPAAVRFAAGMSIEAEQPLTPIAVRPTADAGWMNELLTSLPALTMSRSAKEGGLDDLSSLVTLRRATDRLGGSTLFAPDESIPDGLSLEPDRIDVFSESYYGLRPLYRVLHSDHRRGLAVARSADVLVEALIGYLESNPVPGSVPVRDDADRLLGWGYPSGEASDEWQDAPTLDELRTVWRGYDIRSGLHYYGSAWELRNVPGVRLETIAVSLRREPCDGGSCVAIHALRSVDGMPARGLITRSGTPPPGVSVDPQPIGYLAAAPADGAREIVLRRAAANGDLLCTRLRNEGDDVGFETIMRLGFEPPP